MLRGLVECIAVHTQQTRTDGRKTTAVTNHNKNERRVIVLRRRGCVCVWRRVSSAPLQLRIFNIGTLWPPPINEEDNNMCAHRVLPATATTTAAADLPGADDRSVYSVSATVPFFPAAYTIYGESAARARTHNTLLRVRYARHNIRL